MGRLDFALLCQSALVLEGSVSILGGGAGGVTVPSFPAQIPISVVARMIWDLEDIRQMHVLRIVAHHEDGEPIGEVTVQAVPEPAPPGLPSFGFMVAAVPLLARRSGRYLFDIHLNGTNLKTMEFVVQAVLPPA